MCVFEAFLLLKERLELHSELYLRDSLCLIDSFDLTCSMIVYDGAHVTFGMSLFGILTKRMSWHVCLQTAFFIIQSCRQILVPNLRQLAGTVHE